MPLTSARERQKIRAMRRSPGGLALAGASLLLAACGGAPAQPEAAFERPVARLADDAGGRPAALATIADETRYVLAAPPRVLLVWNQPIELASERRIVLEPELTGALAQATRIVVLPHLESLGLWRALPAQVLEVPPAPLGAARRVSLELAAPREAGHGEAQVSVYAYALEPLALDTIESRAVAIPPSARLEFGFGAIEPALAGDPVEFSIDACEGSRCAPLFSERFTPDTAAGWQDRSVSLAAHAGETRSFRFRTQRLSQQGLISLPVWANPTLYARVPRPAAARNLILLSIDTLRADHLTPYGYVHDTTPFMQRRFADAGTVFENAVAAATVTTPSHMTIFTGLQPAVTGVVDGLKALPPGFVMLAERVRAAGVDTGAVTEDGWLGIASGFGRGFDSFAENRSDDIMAPRGQVDVTFAKAGRWLARHRDKHFFLFLHTFQVHTPYAPPAAYDALFAEHEGELVTKRSPLEARLRQAYDREIRYVDDELRSLFARLAELGLDEDTVFVVVSDHGEEFLEHGRLEHGSQNYQESVHVPLLLTGPGIPSGRRVATPVGHADLLPTFLELLGLPLAAAEQAGSLARLLDGAAAPRLEDRALFSESAAGSALDLERMFPVPAPSYSVRRGFQKVARVRTRDGFRYEYYDLARDPREREDLFATRGKEVADLVALLDGYERSSAALRERAEAGAARAGVPEIRLDPAQEQKLRALGYLE
jgi:arylsulfatase A-like enzyme